MKRIAMKCTQDEFNTIRQILIDNEFDVKAAYNFQMFPYLVNDYNGNGESCVGTTNIVGTSNREVHEIWNLNIFLQYCGIEPKFILPEKWCVKASSCETVQQFFLSYKNNDISDFVRADYFDYYFHSSTVGNNWQFAYQEIQEGFTEITFEQFKKYVMKSEFILPKKWYCVVTEENKEMLNKWRKTVAASHLKVNVHANYLILSKHAVDNSNYHSSFLDFKQDDDYTDYVEITTEQFKQYVLKEEIEQVTQEITELPKHFAILNDLTNPLWKIYIKWLNENYDNDFNGDSELCYYGYNGGSTSFCRRPDNLLAELTILTLEQWNNIINGNQNKTEIMNTQKLTITAGDVTTIYNIACLSWKRTIAGYLAKVNNDGNIVFTQAEVDDMFKSATTAQIPFLEKIFGKQREPIDLTKLKIGSVVMLKYSGKMFMINDKLDFDKPFTIIMYNAKGRINVDGMYVENNNNNNITFVQNINDKGYFASCLNKDIDFITEVISY